MRRNPGMDYDHAVRWALASANMLASMPPPTPKEKDDVGLSSTTWGPLTSYALSDPEEDVSVHMSGINWLRQHSKSQLNRQEWEEAYKAIKQRFQEEHPRGDVDRQDGRDEYAIIFHKDGHYLYPKDPGEFSVEPGKMPPGLWVNSPYGSGVEKGIPRHLCLGGYEKNRRYWRVFTSPDTWLRVANNIERAYPKGAAHIRKHWREWAEEMPESKTQTEPTQQQGSANQGSVGSLRYTWDKGNFRVLIVPPHGTYAGEFAKVGRAGSSWANIDGSYVVSVPTSGVAEFIANASAMFPQMAALKKFVEEWGSEKSSLAQSREQGVAEGGSWKLESRGVPTLSFYPEGGGFNVPAIQWYREVPTAKFSRSDGVLLPLSDLARALPLIQNVAPKLAAKLKTKQKEWATDLRPGRGKEDGIQWNLSVPSGILKVYVANVKGLASRVAGGDYGKDADGWHAAFNEKNVQKVVDALRDMYPRLAEAMSRAFGGASAAMDEEANACALLEHLSGGKDGGAVEYADIPTTESGREARETVEDVRKKLESVFPRGLRAKPYQVIGVAFAKMTGFRALIGDAMGLGKTIQGIGCLAVAPDELLPALVVAPANVTANWEEEINKWLPNLPVKWLEDGKDALPSKSFRGVVVASWDMMTDRRDDLLTFGFKCVIADEAHYAKNPKAARSKALRSLVTEPGPKDEVPPGAKPAPHVVLLTGTPFKNAIVELHTLLSMVNPDVWGKRKEFEKQFSGLERKKGGKEQAEEDEYLTQYDAGAAAQNRVIASEALRSRLLCSMIRRKKNRALKDLPAKMRITVSAPLAPAEAAEYVKAAADFSMWLERAIHDKLIAMGIDPKTARSEAMDAVETALRAEILVKIGRLREIAARGKIPTAIKLARKLAAKGESFLIWCDHKEVVRALQQALEASGIKFGTIDGSTPSKDRQKLKHQFQDGKIQAIVCTQAAKEGLTLTRGAAAIFVEHFWTAADEQQAEDRQHRIGQTRPVTVAYLHAAGTIDDYMRETVESKRALVDEIIGDEETEAKAQDEAQADIVKTLTRGTAVTPGSIYKAMYRNASVGLRAWLTTHEADVLSAVEKAMVEGIQSAEDAMGTMEGRLRQNPRRCR